MSKPAKLESVRQTSSEWEPEKADVLRLIWSRENGKRLMELEQVVELCRVFGMDPWSAISSIAAVANEGGEIGDISTLHADIVAWLCRSPRDELAKLVSEKSEPLPNCSGAQAMREEFRRVVRNELRVPGGGTV